MKINYWVLKLKVSTLVKIVLRSKRDTVARLTYIEAGKAASFLLKLLTKLKKIKFSLHKIEPRDRVAGPLLYLSGVRNDKGEVISLTIYRHILEVRRQITLRLMSGFKGLYFFKNQKPLNMITACLGLRIAEQISPAVYLAHFARWKYYKTGTQEKVSNIMVLPGDRWDRFLPGHFENLLDQVIIENHKQNIRGELVTIAKSLVKSLFTLCFSRSSPDSLPSLTANPGVSKLMVYYAMGVKKGERNDIGFLHESNIDPGRLVMYLKYETLLPSPVELEWMKQHKVCYFTAPGVAVSSGLPAWQSGKSLRRELIGFYRRYLKTLGEILRKRETHGLWLLAELWQMGKAAAYWKDFFLSNNVGILINSIPSADNFIPNLAISEIGGIAVDMERSILLDYCTYIHNPPCHVHFIAGPYSLGQIPEPTFSLHTLQVGALSVNKESRAKIEGIDQLRGQTKKVICVFDEIANDVFFGDTIEQFYRALMELVYECDTISLLVKTKKPQVLDGMPHIKAEIEQLVQKGRCIMASWKVTASEAAAQSDLVVCVPSTAAFESVLTGTSTIIFNPMRSSSSLFYTNNGLNHRIFEESDALVTAVKKFIEGSDASIGDCTDLIPEIDPFDDGKGAERVGNYLARCLQGFDAGLDREEILRQANKYYSGEKGKNRLSHENTYEIL